MKPGMKPLGWVFMLFGLAAGLEAAVAYRAGEGGRMAVLAGVAILFGIGAGLFGSRR